MFFGLEITRRNFITHLVFWVSFFVIFTFFWTGRLQLEQALARSFVITFFQMVVVYTNLGLLMPKFYENKRYSYYILLSVLLIIFIAFAFQFIDFQIAKLQNDFPERPTFRRGGRPRMHKGFDPEFREMFEFFRRKRGGEMFRVALKSRIFFNLTLVLSVFMISTAYRLSQIALKKEKEAVLLRNEKLDAEMKFLKSQINPHFLFNALNNAYTLSYIKSDDAPDVILKLSDILRYLIYDCNVDKVPLEKELTYIQNYIDLQKIKAENVDNIRAAFEVEDSQITIEPMLLIPFIENSFKHSNIEDAEKGWVDIRLRASKKELDFEIKNSLPEKEFTKDKVGGIGLENVKKRMAMLYPDNHELVIEKKDDFFRVRMNILF